MPAWAHVVRNLPAERLRCSFLQNNGCHVRSVNVLMPLADHYFLGVGDSVLLVHKSIFLWDFVLGGPGLCTAWRPLVITQQARVWPMLGYKQFCFFKARQLWGFCLKGADMGAKYTITATV